MIVHSFAGLNVFIPADNDDRSVFEFAASLLVAGDTVALKLHANGIVVPGFSLVGAVKKSSAKAGRHFSAPIGKSRYRCYPISVFENGHGSGRFRMMSPRVRNFLMRGPCSAAVLGAGNINSVVDQSARLGISDRPFGMIPVVLVPYTDNAVAAERGHLAAVGDGDLLSALIEHLKRSFPCFSAVRTAGDVTRSVNALEGFPYLI